MRFHFEFKTNFQKQNTTPSKCSHVYVTFFHRQVSIYLVLYFLTLSYDPRFYLFIGKPPIFPTRNKMFIRIYKYSVCSNIFVWKNTVNIPFGSLTKIHCVGIHASFMNQIVDTRYEFETHLQRRFLVQQNSCPRTDFSIGSHDTKVLTTLKTISLFKEFLKVFHSYGTPIYEFFQCDISKVSSISWF